MGRRKKRSRTQKRGKRKGPHTTPSGKKQFRRNVALSAVILLVASVALYLAFASTQPSVYDVPTGEVPSVGAEIGQMGPDFALRTVDGGGVSLADFRGKPVILWFMAAWCPTCVGQSQALQRITAEFGDAVEVIVIDLWVSDIIGNLAEQIPIESAEDLKRFRDTYGEASWNWVMDTEAVTITYGIGTVDSTVILDGEGVIVFKQFGPTGYDPLLEAVRGALS
ncbi:MAG: peroxiredoxin family protein [Candidatus Geothermarchaeales archaeon]